MLDTWMNVGIGVISGVITSALIYLLVQIFSKIVLPWYRELVYNGIDISGEWFCYGQELEQRAKYDIKQQASQINGDATYMHSDDHDHSMEKIRTFKITGFIKERFVQLTLIHSDKSRLGLVSYLLEVVGDGRRMIGAGSHYGVDSFTIETVNIIFSRFELGEKELKEHWAYINEPEVEEEEKKNHKTKKRPG